MSKQKKYTLTFDQTYNFDLVGICSHHSDYRLAWSLNTQLRTRFQKSDEDYLVTNRKGELVSEHSMYEFRDEENRLDYYLVKNKVQGKFLIPEKPTIDFFLFLCDNCAIDPEELVSTLRSNESVLAAYCFDPEDLPTAETIVF